MDWIKNRRRRRRSGLWFASKKSWISLRYTTEIWAILLLTTANLSLFFSTNRFAFYRLQRRRRWIWALKRGINKQLTRSVNLVNRFFSPSALGWFLTNNCTIPLDEWRQTAMEDDSPKGNKRSKCCSFVRPESRSELSHARTHNTETLRNHFVLLKPNICTTM